eukprot:1182251-Prorocentrum_minimum.AAC.1
MLLGLVWLMLRESHLHPQQNDQKSSGRAARRSPPHRPHHALPHLPGIPAGADTQREDQRAHERIYGSKHHITRNERIY